MLVYPNADEKKVVHDLHRHYAWVFFLWLVLVVSAILVNQYYADSMPYGNLIPTAIVSISFITFVLLLLFNTWLHKQAEGVFFKAFATANNFAFEEKGDPASLTGAFFLIGGQRSVTAVSSGTYGGYPFRLFNYEANMRPVRYRSGKDSPNFVMFTTFELTFANRVPGLLFVSRKSNLFLGDEEIISSGKQKLSLEGNFDQHFSVYCEPASQIIALQILTPDVMQTFIENEEEFNFEFIGDRVYIYATRLAETENMLTKLFSFADFLVQYELPRLLAIQK